MHYVDSFFVIHSAQFFIFWLKTQIKYRDTYRIVCFVIGSDRLGSESLHTYFEVCSNTIGIMSQVNTAVPQWHTVLRLCIHFY